MIWNLMVCSPVPTSCTDKLEEAGLGNVVSLLKRVPGLAGGRCWSQCSGAGRRSAKVSPVRSLHQNQSIQSLPQVLDLVAQVVNLHFPKHTGSFFHHHNGRIRGTTYGHVLGIILCTPISNPDEVAVGFYAHMPCPELVNSRVARYLQREYALLLKGKQIAQLDDLQGLRNGQILEFYLTGRLTGGRAGIWIGRDKLRLLREAIVNGR